MQALSVKEMLYVEQETVEKYKIPTTELMERAGKEASLLIIRKMKKANLKKAIVFAGKGNNGGDGLVIARLLADEGFTSIVITTFEENFTPKDPAGINLKKIQTDKRIEIFYAPEAKQIRNILNAGSKPLIIDSLLGIGTSGKPREIYANYIEIINRTGLAVIAVDIPSGLCADTGKNSELCICADETVTMGFIKKGMLLDKAPNACGNITVADIGFPNEILKNIENKNRLNIITPEIFIKHLKRKPVSHKGDYGKTLICAGCKSFSGAAILATTASIKSGSGLTFSAIPKNLNDIISAAVPSAIKLPLPETKDGFISPEATIHLSKILKDKDVMTLGSGIGDNAETKDFIIKATLNSPVPVVLDADGINAFAGKKDLLKNTKSPLILTPHLKEFSRISGYSVEEIQQNKIQRAKEFVKDTGAILVLKDAKTLCVDTNLTTYININGNPGMAKGGSGDVLAGIIASLVGQKLPLFTAALAGVYLHSISGDIAMKRKGMHSMSPEDITNYLPLAFKKTFKTYL